MRFTQWLATKPPGEEPLLAEAKLIVTEAGKASASLLQRRLRIGYARAARILDILEEQGMVGPAEGAKPREVYTASANNQSQIVPGHETTYDDEQTFKSNANY